MAGKETKETGKKDHGTKNAEGKEVEYQCRHKFRSGERMTRCQEMITDSTPCPDHLALVHGAQTD